MQLFNPSLGLNCPILGDFRANFPSNDTVCFLNPENDPHNAKTVVWATSHYTGPAVGPVRMIEEKDRTVKKSQMYYVSPSWRKGFTEPICTKICMYISVLGVMMY